MCLNANSLYKRDWNLSSCPKNSLPGSSFASWSKPMFPFCLSPALSYFLFPSPVRLLPRIIYQPVYIAPELSFFFCICHIGSFIWFLSLKDVITQEIWTGLTAASTCTGKSYPNCHIWPHMLWGRLSCVRPCEKDTQKSPNLTGVFWDHHSGCLDGPVQTEKGRVL